MSLEVRELEPDCEITDHVVIKDEEMEADVVEVPLQVIQADIVDVEFEAPVKEEQFSDNAGFSGAGLHAECLSPEMKPELTPEPVYDVKDENMLELDGVQQFNIDLPSQKEKMSLTKRCDTDGDALRPTMDTRRIQHIVKINTTEILSLALNTIVRTVDEACLCKICQKPAEKKTQLCGECERERAIKLLGSLYGKRDITKQSKSDTKLMENLNESFLEIQSDTMEIGESTQTEQPRQESSSNSVSEHKNESDKREKLYYCEMCKAKLKVAHKLCQLCEGKEAQLLYKPPILNLDLNCWVRLERCEAAEEALRRRIDALIVEKRTSIIKCQLKADSKRIESEKPKFNSFCSNSKYCKMCKTQHNGPHQFCEVCERQQAAKQIEIIRTHKYNCRVCGDNFTSPNLLLDHRKIHVTPNIKCKRVAQNEFRFRLGRYNYVYCDDCDAPFTNRTLLARHKSTHAHVCKTCSIRCRSLASLREHETIHSKASGRYHVSRP